MNSLEFKTMEGAMFEQAAFASKIVRPEQMNGVLAAAAAAAHGIPHEFAHEFIRQQDGDSPEEGRITGDL